MASRLVEEMFARGMKDLRARGAPEDSERALDGRAVVALLITHFLADHSAAVVELRRRMPVLSMEDQRELWNTLDSKEERWASPEHIQRGSPDPPGQVWPLHSALHSLFSAPPGAVDPARLAEVAWAMHDALRSRTAGALADEILSDAFSLSEWSKTMAAEAALPPIIDVPMMEARPPVRSESMFAAVKTEKMAAAKPALDTADETKELAPDTAPFAVAPSWAPTAAVVVQPAASYRTESMDPFEAQLLAACRETERRRRQLI